VGARVQHHLFFQLVAELEGRSLLIPPSQGPVFNWVGLFLNSSSSPTITLPEKPFSLVDLQTLEIIHQQNLSPGKAG
jgi:hypothetical protein